MGVPNSQLTTIFSANSRLTTNFGELLTFTFLSEYYSVITRIFLLSVSLSLLGVGPNKIEV